MLEPWPSYDITPDLEVPITEDIIYENYMLEVHGFGTGIILESDSVIHEDPDTTEVRNILIKGVYGVWGHSVTQRVTHKTRDLFQSTEDPVQETTRDHQNTEQSKEGSESKKLKTPDLIGEYKAKRAASRRRKKS